MNSNKTAAQRAKSAYEARNPNRKAADGLTIHVGAALKARYMSEKEKSSATHAEFLEVLLDCYASKI